MRLSRRRARATSTAALEAFGLAALADIPAAYLSAGQKRRLGLARLLLAERPLWLLDEPTVSLDTAAQEMLASAVTAHRARGGLVVAATHMPLGLRPIPRAACSAPWPTPHERILASFVRRDLSLAWSDGGAVGVALGFYLMVVTLLPLGIGPDLDLLARIAPGVLWVALLLSALLSLGRMFESDLEDGSLEVLATGPLPLEGVAAAKSLAHWLTTGLPLDGARAGAGPAAQPAAGGLRHARRQHAGRHAGDQLPRRPSARRSPCARAAADCCWPC